MPRHLPPKPLTTDEASALLRACGNDTWVNLRNRALVTLLYRTGLRISEALALYPKDLDLTEGAVRVLRGKGGRSRVVGIDPTGASVVAAWDARRETLGLSARSLFICTGAGNCMSTGYARRLLAQPGRSVGIEKRVHMHGLRYTHAVELCAEDVDIGVISKQLGIGPSRRQRDTSITSRRWPSLKRCAQGHRGAENRSQRSSHYVNC